MSSESCQIVHVAKTYSYKRGTLTTLIVVVILFVVYHWYMANIMGGSASHNMAAPFVVNPSAKHTATVIFLHGLGDTGQGWSMSFQTIKHAHIKYVCPNAEVMPVTLNAGFRMPSWFDIKGLEPGSEEDEDGINRAANLLESLVSEEEKKGIPRNRIMVGGFSQGGAVALIHAFTLNKPPLAGVLGLSTWLPMHQSFPQVAVSNKNTPILQCHGQADPLVPYDFGNLTSKMLQTFNSQHEFKSYEGMGHSSCETEMKDVKDFIEKHLPPV